MHHNTRVVLTGAAVGAVLGLVVMGVWALAMDAHQTAAQATTGAGYTIERAVSEDAICWRVNEPDVGRSDWTCHPRVKPQKQTKVKKIA